MAKLPGWSRFKRRRAGSEQGGLRREVGHIRQATARRRSPDFSLSNVCSPSADRERDRAMDVGAWTIIRGHSIPFDISSEMYSYGEIREKKTRFEIPRILAKYRRLAMHVKEMQPSVSVLDATDRERTQRIVASFIINLFKSLSESAQDFDSQQPFTRSPPFAPPLIRCARQGQAAAAARRLCAHVALVRSLT